MTCTVGLTLKPGESCHYAGGNDYFNFDFIFEGFRLDNDVLAICPNAAATPLLSLDKYNRFTKNC